jgi:hypothetical protein
MHNRLESEFPGAQSLSAAARDAAIEVQLLV